jgi:peptidoglycan/LPS O-acetylase OafA/YrhL
MDRRNVSLDTLRSAAIILVVNCHIASKFAHGHLRYVQLGGRGVDLFFVLSGWLLGHYLLAELKQTGSLEVRRFWLRRWLRTLPAYYAILALTFAQQFYSYGVGSLHWEFLVFLQNYMVDMHAWFSQDSSMKVIPYFGISWSLCVEEHFYLAVAPLLLLFAKVPRTRLLVVPLLLAPTVCRWLGWYGSGDQTHVRYDQCAAGVVLAATAVFRPGLWRWLCRAAPILALAGLAASAFNVEERLRPGGRDLSTDAWTLIFASFVLLANSNDFWRWRARVPGSRYVAERSYSLYLVHIEALVLVSRLLDRLEVTSLPLAYLLTWIVALAFAEILYRVIERPFMQAREFFGASRSPRSPIPKKAELATVTTANGTLELAKSLPGSSR